MPRTKPEPHLSLEALAHEIDRLKQAAREAQAEAQRLQDQLAAAERAVVGRERDVEGLETEMRNVRSAAQSLETSHREAQAEVQGLQGQLQQSRAKVETLEGLLEEEASRRGGDVEALVKENGLLWHVDSRGSPTPMTEPQFRQTLDRYRDTFAVARRERPGH